MPAKLLIGRRHRLLARLLLLALLLGRCGLAVASSQPLRRFEDPLGHVVEWRTPPERIVSLSPSLTEILFAIGCDTTHVVGVTRFCNFPPEARDVPRVGGVVDPSLEAVLLRKPDLVLVTRGNPLEFIESLVRLGIPVYGVETRGRLARILATIAEVGAVTGREGAARRLIERLQATLQDVRQRTATLAPERRPRVFFGELEGAHWTAGPGSYVHGLIEAAGGENIGSVAPSAWSPLSLETIIERDPEVYWGTFGEEGEAAARERVLSTLRNATWSQTSLGRTPRLFLAHEDVLQRPGPRVIELLPELARYLHPELWSWDGQ